MGQGRRAWSRVFVCPAELWVVMGTCVCSDGQAVQRADISAGGATSRDFAGATRPGRVSSLVMLVALGVVPLLAPAPVFSAVL